MTETDPLYPKLLIQNPFLVKKEKEIVENWRDFISSGDGLGNCFLWNTPSYMEEEIMASQNKIIKKYLFFSPRTGGWYSVDWGITNFHYNTLTPTQKACLTTWLIEKRKTGLVPLIDETILNNINKLTPMKTVDKARNFLKILAEGENRWMDVKMFGHRAEAFGNVNLSEIKALRLYAYSESVDRAGVEQIISHLKKENHIENHNPSYPYTIRLTLEGKIATEQVTNEDSDEGFIAMWIDDSMNDLREAIEKGIKQAGYKAIRIDLVEHNNDIVDEIIAAIRRARFVVADFTHGETGARGGVYYEAGFAHGIGIEVIFTCHEDIMKDTHFDTEHYNHITWTKRELKDSTFAQKIASRISATIGDGPHKVKHISPTSKEIEGTIVLIKEEPFFISKDSEERIIAQKVYFLQ